MRKRGGKMKCDQVIAETTQLCPQDAIAEIRLGNVWFVACAEHVEKFKKLYPNAKVLDLETKNKDNGRVERIEL
jgi:hypothetical protein